METEVKLTKLASCAGCGAKMGAGTLAKMLEGFKTHSASRLIAGYDKSHDAPELASMGLIPAGTYRNREYAEHGVKVSGNISLAMQDLMYDPQTSGGLLFALPEEAYEFLRQLKEVIPQAAIVGYVREKEDAHIYLE